MWDLCVKVLLMLGLTVLGLNTTWHYHLGTNIKLLHHSAISSTPSGVIISICCNWSNSYVNGCCSIYVTDLGGTWYGLLLGLSCNENVPSKHPMPLNTFLNFLCICYASLALFLLSISVFGQARKYFVSMFLLVLLVDTSLLLSVLKVPSLFVQHFPAPWISYLAFDILVSSMQLSFWVSSASNE